MHRHSPNDNQVIMFDENEKEYKEPETWTMITALDRVLSQAHNSRLSDEFWESVRNPVSYLTENLELTRIQVVFLAMLIEAGEPMSWKEFGDYLNCSRLSMMIYSEELEKMIAKRWLIRQSMNGFMVLPKGFAVDRGVMSALLLNKKFVPEKIDGLTEQEFVNKLENRVSKHLNRNYGFFSNDEEWMELLCAANPQLPLCQVAMSLDDIHEKSLLLMAIFDYAQWADSADEGLTMDSIDRLYPDDYECGWLREQIQNGTHILIEKGYIEHKCEEGIADTERIMLTSKAKQELLSEYKPTHTKVVKPRMQNRYLKSCKAIRKKEMFFNETEQEQIERLTSLLSKENFASVQQRLEEQKMRKGFACLFYGAPGTGKTETVLQIARKTGRNIMQVDIAGLKDKWVGESEKNIKSVFSQYKKLCQSSEVMPILFFNEADAIINKRSENVSHSVDKMDNAMQNIILQEMEDLEGILIATTNLTSNLDNAFERRFLFKVEFRKPDTDVKVKLWSSMLGKDISDDDAHRLAVSYDFSGGQIENIARKRTIDYVLYGKQATFEVLDSYCKAESLNKNTVRPAIGFRA